MNDARQAAAASPFHVEGLDHVAITVTDVARSADWYRDVLGFERLHGDPWNGVPTMVGSGSTGLALFPVQGPSPKPRPGRDVLSMRHVAFRVTASEYVKAKAAFERRGIGFEEQDHQISWSIYIHDPDGHEIELTTYESVTPA